MSRTWCSSSCKRSFRRPAKTLLRGDWQLLFSQMTGIEQRSGQRRADLMSQRRNHATERRQALMTSQLILQMTGFSQVVEQHQLTGFGIQRARGDRQTPTVLERDFVTVILARCKASSNHMTPQLAFERQTEQFSRGGISFAHDALGVDDDDAAGQQIEEVLQTVGQAFFFSASSCMR